VVVVEKNKKRILYVLIHKVASRSILRAINSVKQVHYNGSFPEARIKDILVDLKFDYGFSYVRNPYTRFTSSFFYTKQFKNQARHKTVDEFLDFLEKFDIENYIIGQGGNKVLHHSVPQTSYLEGRDGKINTDINIFKIEDPSKWGLVQSIFFNFYKVNLPNLKNFNVTKEKYDLNLSHKQKERIYNLYKKDFINFNYSSEL
jgi:hypothetical protein